MFFTDLIKKLDIQVIKKNKMVKTNVIKGNEIDLND